MLHPEPSSRKEVDARLAIGGVFARAA